MILALISATLLIVLALAFLQEANNRNLNETRKVIMAAIDDLKAADAAEAQTLTILAQAQQDEVLAFQNFIATLQNNPDSATVEQVATAMNGRVQNMQAIADALKAASPQPTGDAPTS